jgi:seryl-tRNA synthetase
MLMGAVKKAADEAAKAEAEAKVNEVRAKVNGEGEHLKELEDTQEKLHARIQEILYTIPR